ncbi:hypothetical protein TheetDRAFT_2507 [Thermoanaerobacter ethanolicus JW 200]|nr:hypothetical protein TheetDRAFT_2507 [Thermoanaerobacter ethanolicus JW 200]
MQDLLEVCCGLDVHKETIVACLLKGSVNDEKPEKTIRTFSTLLKDLEELKHGLKQKTVIMLPWRVQGYTGNPYITYSKVLLMVTFQA